MANAMLINLITKAKTRAESNLTTGHIAAAHGRLNGIRQVAPVCTPS